MVDFYLKQEPGFRVVAALELGPGCLKAEEQQGAESDTAKFRG